MADKSPLEELPECRQVSPVKSEELILGCSVAASLVFGNAAVSGAEYLAESDFHINVLPSHSVFWGRDHRVLHFQRSLSKELATKNAISEPLNPNIHNWVLAWQWRHNARISCQDLWLALPEFFE